MDHATGVNDRGELALFIDPTPIKPDGYRLQGRELTVLAGKSKVGTYTLDDVAFGAASRRPDRDILVVELDGNNEARRTTPVPNVDHPTEAS